MGILLQGKSHGNVKHIAVADPSMNHQVGVIATMIHGNPSYPPKATPPRNKALLRVYWPLVSLNKALLTPYSWGGSFGGDS